MRSETALDNTYMQEGILFLLYMKKLSRLRTPLKLFKNQFLFRTGADNNSSQTKVNIKKVHFRSKDTEIYASQSLILGLYLLSITFSLVK